MKIYEMEESKLNFFFQFQNDMAKLQQSSKEMKKESVDDHMNPAGFPRNNVLIHS